LGQLGQSGQQNNNPNFRPLNLNATLSWQKGPDGFTAPTAVSPEPTRLDETDNFKGVLSELDDISVDKVQETATVAYIVRLINGNPWGYTTNKTDDPNLSLTALQVMVSNHDDAGVKEGSTGFTQNDALIMNNENRELIQDTVEIPYDKVAGQIVTLSNLAARTTDPATKATIQNQINILNGKLSALQQAMAGGSRRRRSSRRSRRRRGHKRARRYSKTRYARQY
jgi:hypothetical protein